MVSKEERASPSVVEKENGKKVWSFEPLNGRLEVEWRTFHANGFSTFSASELGQLPPKAGVSLMNTLTKCHGTQIVAVLLASSLVLAAGITLSVRAQPAPKKAGIAVCKNPD